LIFGLKKHPGMGIAWAAEQYKKWMRSIVHRGNLEDQGWIAFSNSFPRESQEIEMIHEGLEIPVLARWPIPAIKDGFTHWKPFAKGVSY